MPLQETGRRLTLRELLTNAEKHTRHLVDKLHTTWLTQATELRDMSRPTRKKSQFPTYQSLNNARNRMLDIDSETTKELAQLTQELEGIIEHARRELAIRA